MCGICGIALSTPEPVRRDLLGRMTDMVTHRGPDSDGYCVDRGIGLGVRRLKIIDLETGDQPITNENGSVIVVCNGEIYNFPELKEELVKSGHRFRTHSDVEVIAHLYEDYGVDCLKKLRGMFGLAIWDAKQSRLMLARDRLGIKPLHYAVAPDGSLYFGSEIKSLQLINLMMLQNLGEL